MGQRTPLYECHVSAGARIVDFGGWDMPVVYSSIQEEHAATRQGIGLFDISHMGRLAILDAHPADSPNMAAQAEFLDALLTNRIDNLKPGQVRYALATNDAGGILDDVLVTRLEGRHLVVVNASNRMKIINDWLPRTMNAGIRIHDHTHESAMIAAQGPKALELCEAAAGIALAGVAYYYAIETEVLGRPAIVSRTGYTGEDGFEFILPSDFAVDFWEKLLELGRPLGARPAGLGARDTLRLEAGMPLYGHELSEEIDPIQAGLGWAVKAKDRDFRGKDAILCRPADRPVRVGLQFEGKRIPREGFAVFQGDRSIGRVTSGTYSPTLDRPLAMGYVEPFAATAGQEVEVDIRGTRVPARVVPLPFYKRRPSDS